MDSEHPDSDGKMTDGGQDGDSEQDDGKRKFTVRFADGSEKHQFEVQAPYFAALKAARRLIDPDGYMDSDTAREENTERFYLREIGTYTLHVYKGWTWIRNDACPECESRRVYERKMETPRFRCASCGAEFEEPADADEVEGEDDLPDHLAGKELTGAEVESLGRSKVPEDELKLGSSD